MFKLLHCVKKNGRMSLLEKLAFLLGVGVASAFF